MELTGDGAMFGDHVHLALGKWEKLSFPMVVLVLECCGGQFICFDIELCRPR